VKFHAEVSLEAFNSVVMNEHAFGSGRSVRSGGVAVGVVSFCVQSGVFQ